MKILLLLFCVLSLSSFAQDEASPGSAGSTGSDDINLIDPNTVNQKPEYTPENNAVSINLMETIEKGLRLNPDQRIRGYERELFELNWDQTFYNFWLPSPQIVMTNSDQKLTRVASKTSNGQNLSTLNKSPNYTFGFDMGEYTLFNWGRDYLQYQNNQQSYKRNLQRLNEQKRRLKFNIIRQYFNLVRIRQILKIKKEQLRHTSFIYRLAKEKVVLKKITKQDYYQARGEFLRAQTEYQEAQYNLVTEQEKLANFLGDSLQTAYSPQEQLLFKPLAVSLADAIDNSLKQSPNFKDVSLGLENAERSYEKALRDNMPLPKLSVNFGTYSYNYTKEGPRSTYETNPGNSNVELVATVNMTWDLWGGEGLFNSRRNKRFYIDKKIAEIEYFNVRRELELKMRMSYQQVKFIESQIQISTVQLDNAHKNFDVILDNYTAGQNSFADLKNAIKGLVDSGINVENSKYEHMDLKLSLCEQMGLDDFPGERFEDLVIK